MEILHLTQDDVKDINKAIMNRNLDPGDFYNIRDDATLDYIIYRHQNAKTLEEKAGELLFGIAKNQIFANGNKRTAFEATQAFLLINGIKLNLSIIFSIDELEEIVLKVATGKMSKAEVVKWIKNALRK
jgi:death-on-curing protein